MWYKCVCHLYNKAILTYLLTWHGHDLHMTCTWLAHVGVNIIFMKRSVGVIFFNLFQSFVYENNLYYQSSPSSDYDKLTTDGDATYIFNGVPDWLYEGEILDLLFLDSWAKAGYNLSAPGLYIIPHCRLLYILYFKYEHLSDDIIIASWTNLGIDAVGEPPRSRPIDRSHMLDCPI